MKKYTPIILLIVLSLLVSGCEIFPYVTQPEPAATSTSPEPSATPEPTDPPPTATLVPSATPTPTTTPEQPTEEPADPTPTITPVYGLQQGVPITLPNFNHPEDGCGWLGVAGQVFNAEGLEVLGLTVQVGDSQNPNEDPIKVLTGEALAYGLGGFEIQIGDEVFESNERFWIQVVDEAGTPLTLRHFINTHADCEGNLILINFVPLEENSTKDAPTPTTPAYP